MRIRNVYSFVLVIEICVVIVLFLILFQWNSIIPGPDSSLITTYEIEDFEQGDERKLKATGLTQIESENGFESDIQYTDGWSFFSAVNNEPLLRRFSFIYPSMFQVENTYTNSRVWLKKDNQYLLGIEETFPLTEFYIGNTQDEKFISFYFFKKNIYREYPKLEFELVTLGESNFLYKVVESDKDMRYGEIFKRLENWNRYLGVIDKKGVDVVDLKKLPDDVVLTILRSIHFR